MDTRIALKNNTALKFYNSDNGLCTYIIEKELARGASSIVYEASYTNNSGVKRIVRIKECYPFNLSIKRCENGKLEPVNSDIEKFQERKEKMKLAFDLGNELFNTRGLTNYTTNAVDIYEFNNTIYVVTTYQEGEILLYKSFLSLKNCITIVKSTAKVIEKIHDKGYLYLDIKPENIFALEGTYEIVQMFDFDSLVHIKELEKGKENCEYKISYTKGYSALELKLGNYKKIGRHTDVYAIGAVLFYLLFGYSPGAYDCEIDAKYDYKKSKFADFDFQDKLYFELTDFFHNTLANFYLDRYTNMQQVISKLELIENLADTSVPYVYRSSIFSPKIFVGRQTELLALREWSKKTDDKLIFVTGMGGIGKSSLVKNFLSKHANSFDIILYLNYHHSLIMTILDDKQFAINTIEKNTNESPEEYFYRKLAIAKKITNNQRVIMIIDNFDGDDLSGIDELLKLNWKIIIISRSNMFSKEYSSISIDSMRNKEDICKMMECYIRRSMNSEELLIADKIIERVNGHTLALELISKQIENSFLSLERAHDLLFQNGIFGISNEKVAYTKDSVSEFNTVKNIINNLFSFNDNSIQKKNMLKAIAFFGINGIEVNIFAEVYGLSSKDMLNELISQGWLSTDNYILIMHPLIMENMLGYELNEEFTNIVNRILIELKKLLLIDKENFLSLSEAFLESCKNQNMLTSMQSYRELLFLLITNMPRYREAYILNNAIALSNNLGELNSGMIIKIYEVITEIYEEKQELDEAYKYIIKAEEFIEKIYDNHVKGIFYYMLVGYYDNKLEGRYNDDSKEYKKVRKLLIKALNKAIKYMKRSQHTDKSKLLSEYLRCKANVLIRSDSYMKHTIIDTLNKVGLIIESEGLENSEFVGAYYLTWAWFYAYFEQDIDKIHEYILKAYNAEVKLCENELDLIDNLFVPAANIVLECGETEEAEHWLKCGVNLCNQNEGIIPFIRKKRELYTYLLDVYMCMENDEKYKEAVSYIDAIDEKYEEYLFD